MAEPTLDELVAFMKKHGVEKVDSITDEKSAIKHFRAASRVYKEERNSLRKQRDELINDMAEIKKKAEAWDKQKDELREMVTFGCHFEEDTPSKYMNVAYRIVLKIMCELDGTNDFKNLSSDLKRGSDGHN
ncbi:acetyltransferase [Staphylococcus hominis]|uniref:acetyltransferase n=1 Tax=Staphylococcus hominis TaxID=1290 RepID=UPI002F26A327